MLRNRDLLQIWILEFPFQILKKKSCRLQDRGTDLPYKLQSVTVLYHFKFSVHINYYLAGTNASFRTLHCVAFRISSENIFHNCPDNNFGIDGKFPITL